MKIYLILALLLCTTALNLKSNDDSLFHTLENRVEKMAIKVDGFDKAEANLKASFENKKKELEFAINGLNSSGWDRFYGILGTILATVLVLGLALWKGWPGIKASILSEAEKNANEFVNDSLQTSVKAFLAERTKLLEVIVEDYEKRLDLKANKEILILSETKEQGESLARYLKLKGYQKVKFQVPKGTELIKSDLTILDWADQGKGKKYLTPAFISEYAKSFSTQNNLLLYGPQDYSLDLKGTQLIFANYREKLDENIMQKLDAPGESTHFPS